MSVPLRSFLRYAIRQPCIGRRPSSLARYLHRSVCSNQLRSCCSAGRQQGSDVLASREDRYNGVIIDAEQLPASPTTFAARLHHSLEVSKLSVFPSFTFPPEEGIFFKDMRTWTWVLQRWRSSNRRGVWLELKLSQAGLLAVAIDAGFDFKHAQKGHVVLSKWLAADVPDLLPDSATHQVISTCTNWGTHRLEFDRDNSYKATLIFCLAANRTTVYIKT